jgi:hypothetical protein
MTATQMATVLSKEAQHGLTTLTPSELDPLPADSTRLYFSRKEVLDFVGNIDLMERWLTDHIMTTQLDRDTNLFALTFSPNPYPPEKRQVAFVRHEIPNFMLPKEEPCNTQK